MEGWVVLHFDFFNAVGGPGFIFLGLCWRREEEK